MERSSTDVKNECGNMDVLFDGSMLDKLRSCSIIPKHPNDFQIFVRSLTGNSISEAVIQEAWKQIYRNETCPSVTDPENECKSSEQKHPVTAQNTVASTSQSLASTSKKGTKRKQPSDSSAGILKASEKLCSKNGIDDCMSKHNVGVPDIASKPKELYPIIRTSKHMERSEVENKIEVILSETEEEESESSGDCEVIEVVSLNKTNNISSDDCDTDSDNETSSAETDSEKSVEILEPLFNTKQVKGDVCPVHGNYTPINSQSSQESRENKSKCIDPDVQKDYKHTNTETYEKSIDRKKKQKVKKGKHGKYKILRTELKCLKSLLVNLLMSLKSSTMKANGDSAEPASKVNLSGKCQKTPKDSESFQGKKPRMKKTKSRSKVASTEKLKASAFVEVNMSRKTTKLHQKKQQTAKHSKNSNKSCEPLPKIVELNSDTEHSDNGKRKKFCWRETISDTLKSKSGMQMPVEKLKRTVIAKYYYCRGNVSQNTSVKFFRYLHSTAGVVVDGDTAIYSNKLINSVSSKSALKQQFVMKTVTTRKEYKVS